MAIFFGLIAQSLAQILILSISFLTGCSGFRAHLSTTSNFIFRLHNKPRKAKVTLAFV
jgi:hypothetical protein